MFEVCRPVYRKTGEKFRNSEGQELEYNDVFLDVVGIARDMEDANRKFPTGYWARCYSWVLRPIGEVH